MSTDVDDSAPARAEGAGAVLVVDSSPVFAEALTQLLQNRGLDAVHASFAQARSAASALQPMLMLLDGDEPWRQVLACAADVSTASPDTRLLLLVASSGKWCEALAREAGALGCGTTRSRASWGSRRTPSGPTCRTFSGSWPSTIGTNR